MIDFHTHILPELDDGSSCVEESIAMLEELETQGVKKVVLSPHFYAYASDVKQFISDRESSLKKLVAALEGKNLDIDLYLGCEVLYFDELWCIEGLEKFCISGTDYILVEMPASKWTDRVIDGIGKLVSKGLTPVIAHFERYLKYEGNADKLFDLIDLGACLQMNCGYINKFFTRGKAVRFFQKGLVSAIGSDCHNMTERAPNCAETYATLKKKLTQQQYYHFEKQQRILLRNAEKVFSRKR